MVSLRDTIVSRRETMEGIRASHNNYWFPEDSNHGILIRQNKKKLYIKAQNALYIEYQAETFHGKYQSVKHFEHCVQYICKDGNYITSLENLQGRDTGYGIRKIFR